MTTQIKLPKKSPNTKSNRLVISTYDDVKNPYYGGGGARSIHEVASRLSHNFDILVVTGNYPGAKNLVLDGVRYKRIGPSFLGPKSSQLLFHFLLPFYLKKIDFDLWIESLTPPFSTSCLQLYTKKPVLGLVHMLSGEDMARKYKLPFHVLENLGLKTYKFFVAPAQATVDRLGLLHQKPLTFLIPNGVNPAAKVERKRNTESFVLYLGRIEVNQKGLDLLLEAYAKLTITNKAKLVIAGAGTSREEAKLKRLIKEYGVEDQVSLVGQVEGLKKQQLLQDCSFVVVPSRFETFGIVALEGMSYGHPIVSFDIKGLDWVPQGCGFKAPLFDCNHLAKYMLDLLTADTLRISAGEVAKKAAGEYEWGKIADDYRGAITQILNLSEMDHGR